MLPNPDPTFLLNNLMKLSNKSTRIQIYDEHFACNHTRLLEKYSMDNFIKRVEERSPALVIKIISGIGKYQDNDMNWDDLNKIIDDLNNTVNMNIINLFHLASKL